MSPVVSMVLNTVNAPYSVKVSAPELAAKIIDAGSAAYRDVHAFAFFSEVDPQLQLAFVREMGVDEAIAAVVANQFSDLIGYKLAMAA